MDITNTATALTDDVLASVLAHAINLNCEHFHAANISRDEWDAEQRRLWTLAADNDIAAKLMALVCPSLKGTR